jgi:hypothetical protein
MVVLIGVVAVAAVAHEVGWAVATRSSAPRSQALWHGLRAAARRHVLLLGALLVGAAVAVGLRASSSSGLGFYDNTLHGNLFPAGSFASARGHLVYVILGAGLAPAILAFAWSGTNVVRPSGKRAHAFACLLLIAVPVLTLEVGSITRRFDGFIQERYLFYVAPLLIVGMAASFGVRRMVAATAVAGLLVAALVLGARYESSLTAFWFFDSPGLAFYLKVVANGLHNAARWAGAPGLTAVQLGAIAALVVTAGLVLLAARVTPKGRLAVVGTFVVAFSVISTRYDFQQVVYGSLGSRGYGTKSVAGRDWVDRHVPEGANVGILAAQRGPIARSREVWWGEEFWNRSIRRAYVLAPGLTYVWDAALSHRLDFATGRFVASEAGSYIVEPTRFSPLALEGRPIARSPDGRLTLLRAKVPYRAVLAVAGASDDGWLPFDRPARVRIFGASGSRRCARLALTLALPPGIESSRSFRVRARGTSVRRTVSPGTARSLRLTVCAVPYAHHVDVLVGQGRGANPGEAGGLQITTARVVGSMRRP